MDDLDTAEIVVVVVFKAYIMEVVEHSPSLYSMFAQEFLKNKKNSESADINTGSVLF
jgi:hypothetical protein